MLIYAATNRKWPTRWLIDWSTAWLRLTWVQVAFHKKVAWASPQQSFQPNIRFSPALPFPPLVKWRMEVKPIYLATGDEANLLLHFANISFVCFFKQCQKLKFLAISCHKAVEGSYGLLSLLRWGQCPIQFTRSDTKMELGIFFLSILDKVSFRNYDDWITPLVRRWLMVERNYSKTLS